MALGHTVGAAVERAYRRGDLFEERRQLADAWARYCAASQAEGRVRRSGGGCEVTRSVEIGSLPTSGDYLPALLHRHQQGRREAQLSNNREAAISAFWAATSDEELAAAQAAYDAALDAEEAAKAERLLNDLKRARSKTPVFTGSQLVAILASFKAKPGFDAAQFLRRITTMVETYLLPSGADTVAVLPLPSEQKRVARSRA